MKLKDKFFDAIFDGSIAYKRENAIINCESIANDYAMDFVSWLMDNCELIKDKETEENVLWRYNAEDYTIEGLLEIFIEEL